MSERDVQDEKEEDKERNDRSQTVGGRYEGKKRNRRKDKMRKEHEIPLASCLI